MIESIQFKNFKALRDTTLPLGPCTILVGPNGSGKSTVLQALEAVQNPGSMDLSRVLSVGVLETDEPTVGVKLNLGEPHDGLQHVTQWHHDVRGQDIRPSNKVEKQDARGINSFIARMRVFSFDAKRIADAVTLKPRMELASNGTGLAGVLDRLRDGDEERFEALNEELGRWLPEFDRLSFDLDPSGNRLIFLRTRDGHHKIPAADLSQGTLIAIAILTLAYLPDPPSLVGLEEPDRGIHPYLLRHVQDAIYRLTNPEGCGEKREPVQVIATTHSPSFLNLFKDFPQEIVVANKVGADVQFQRLTDQPHFKEILGDAPLGEAWFTGFLGGVPSGT